MSAIRLLFCGLSLFSVVLLGACATEGTSPNSAAAKLGKAGFASINVSSFEAMSRQPGVVLLDVRTADEFAEGHLHGAINMDVTAADFSRKVAALDKKPTYLVYCRAGVRGARACTEMAGLNFPQLYNLDGGITAWQLQGKPVDK